MLSNTSAPLLSCEVRNAKALAVGARGQTRRALEQAAEERRILVADAPADLVDRRVRPLQPALGILDTKALYVGNGGNTRRLREAALERALGQLGALDDLGNRGGDGEVLAQPGLGARDLAVPVIRLAFEHDVRSEAVSVP